MGTNTRGFGPPWAKSDRFWATMGKVYSGLGDYGHKHPRVWATMGKTRSVLGYRGQSLLGFGRSRAKFIWVWATTGKVYLLSGFGLLQARPFITAGLCDGGPL